MTEEVHLPPQAGSPPWRRSFALDLATRDGGDASGVFRRAEAYLAWLAGEGGGESEALGHPGATNGPGTTTDKGAPGTTPENGAQRAEEMVEAAAEAMHALEYPRWSATAHPDHNRWSWRGDGVSEAERDTYRDQARAALAAAGSPVAHAALATESVVGSLRDALASDDPDVVRGAAESLGLGVIEVIALCSPDITCMVHGPSWVERREPEWREVGP